MTFLALLTKELRLRMRRERTIWIIIVYILLMSLLGWYFISRFVSTGTYYNGNTLSQTGIELYFLLSQVQLFLIMFVTPAFTSTTINGEKERQTFDLLLCSRLSAFSLVAGKLVAGLANALLLIAAATPLFSLVFFFGGVSPTQVLIALLIYLVTTLMLGTFGQLCSTLVKRPAVSTAIAYMGGVIWLVLPLVLYVIVLASGGTTSSSPYQLPWFFVWNPVVALYSTYSIAGPMAYSLAGISLPPWVLYTILSIAATVVCFLLSMWTVKPNAFSRLRARKRKAHVAAS